MSDPREERVARVTALALDPDTVRAFDERHDGLDRAALIAAGHLDPGTPAKGTNVIGGGHRRPSGEALLELAKDVLYGLLFGDDSTATHFDRVQRELLTMTLPRAKAGAFEFIPAATELSGAGMWRDPGGVSNDVRADNVIIEVEFGEVGRSPASALEAERDVAGFSRGEHWTRSRPVGTRCASCFVPI